MPSDSLKVTIQHGGRIASDFFNHSTPSDTALAILKDSPDVPQPVVSAVAEFISDPDRVHKTYITAAAGFELSYGLFDDMPASIRAEIDAEKEVIQSGRELRQALQGGRTSLEALIAALAEYGADGADGTDGGDVEAVESSEGAESGGGDAVDQSSGSSDQSDPFNVLTADELAALENSGAIRPLIGCDC